MINVNDKKNCCGCGGCVAVCPLKCISLKEDAEGFLYPEIDTKTCIECGLCERSCPILNSDLFVSDLIPEAYAVYSQDNDIRDQSSSGGVFTVFAEAILQMGGVVFGAAFDTDFSVKHISVNAVEDLKKLRGSKYLQSRTENTYKEVKALLDSGIIVLYSGTACQIAGLKGYLKQEYNNLLTIDVLCHGVPSPKFWKKYLVEQEKKHGGNVQQVFFRHKKYGWKRYAVSLGFSNNTVYIEKYSTDTYMQMFLANICLRPSCHACKFKDVGRSSDITLGDCWGIENTMPEMDDDKGTSVVLIHSKKGQEWFNNVNEKLVMKKEDVDVLLPPIADSRKSVAAHRNRRRFFKELDRNIWDIEQLKNLLAPSFVTKVRSKIGAESYKLKMKLGKIR